MAKKSINKKDNLPMEEVLWKACDALRGSIEPSEYKHVVLSLIFLKYAGFHFEKRRQEIVNDGLEDFVDNVEFYAAKNVFYLPETARWPYLKENSKQPNIASIVDKALSDIEKENKPLRGALEVCRNARCTSFFVHHYTNLFTFFKLRSFEDFFDLCVPSI